MSKADWNPAIVAAVEAGEPVRGIVDDYLEMTTCTVTFDEAWAPYITAEYTAPLGAPGGDPRARDLREIIAGYELPDGTREARRLFQGAITSRKLTEPDNELRFELASAELEYRARRFYGGTPRVWPGGTTVVGQIIEDLLTDYDFFFELTIDPEVPVDFLTEDFTLARGDDMLGALLDLADRLDAWVHPTETYHDWVLEPRPSEWTGNPVAAFTTGSAGNIITLEHTVSLDRWANAVRLIYRDGDQYVQATGQYQPPNTPRRAEEVTRDVDFPGTYAATKAAEAILRRTLSRGEGYELTALARYWLRPGDEVTVSGAPQIVERVAFDLHTCLMTLTTRAPETS